MGVRVDDRDWKPLDHWGYVFLPLPLSSCDKTCGVKLARR